MSLHLPTFGLNSFPEFYQAVRLEIENAKPNQEINLELKQGRFTLIQVNFFYQTSACNQIYEPIRKVFLHLGQNIKVGMDNNSFVSRVPNTRFSCIPCLRTQEIREYICTIANSPEIPKTLERDILGVLEVRTDQLSRQYFRKCARFI